MCCCVITDIFGIYDPQAVIKEYSSQGLKIISGRYANFLIACALRNLWSSSKGDIVGRKLNGLEHEKATLFFNTVIASQRHG